MRSTSAVVSTAFGDGGAKYDQLRTEYDVSTLSFILGQESFTIDMSDPEASKQTGVEPATIEFPKYYKGVKGNGNPNLFA